MAGVQQVSASEMTEETCSIILQKLTVAELKYILRHFGNPVGGVKSVLLSRVTGLLRLKGSTKLGPVILQLPSVTRKFAALIGSAPSKDHCSLPQCKVTFKDAIFYTNIDSLVKPTPLAQTRRSLQTNREVVHVSLTTGQLDSLKLSQTTDDDRSKVFVLLRFCQNISNEPQEDSYPTYISVELGSGRHPPILNSKTKCPVDITKLIVSQTSTQVTLLINWFNNSSNTKGFVYAIDMMKKRVIEDVVKTIPIVSATDARTKVKAKLSAFTSNDEVSSSCQQISFQCPLSMSKLKDPCRGANCKHLQCFDATNYLMLNRTKPCWTCPVCQQNTPFSKLEIDGLQLEILRYSTIGKITFDAEGNWHPLLDDVNKKVVSVDDEYVDPLPKKKICSDKSDLIDLTIDSPTKEAAIPIPTTTIVL